jgi:nucleoside-diphosphate-sugar epimerase
MNTFVTGGSSFVGGNLAEMLVKNGHKVRALLAQEQTAYSQ